MDAAAHAEAKKRTALLRELKEVFRRLRSQPTRRLIAKINPILRGWVNYFAHRALESVFLVYPILGREKIRRHLARAR